MAIINYAALNSVLNAAAQSAIGGSAAVGQASAQNAVAAADELIGMLESSAAGSGANADFGWAHGSPTVSGAIATIEVYAGNNTRPSLYQYGYPGGATDLVSLLDEGYSASGTVYGTWHGEEIRSRTTFDGAHFLESAISAFNSGNSYNAVATLTK